MFFMLYFDRRSTIASFQCQVSIQVLMLSMPQEVIQELMLLLDSATQYAIQ